MRITPEEYVKRLIEACHKKLILLKDMLELTGRQAQSINEDELENLEKLVAEKQAKIDEIDRLDEEFDVYFKRLKSELKVESMVELNNYDIEGLKELQDCISKIMQTIIEIGQLEKQNNEKAKNLLTAFGSEIEKLNQAKKVNTAYTPASAKPPSYFIDKKK